MSDHRLRFLAGRTESGAERILDRLDGSTVRIVLMSTGRNWTRELLLVTLVDLLGRVLPRLDVVVADEVAAPTGTHPGEGTRLRARINAARCRSPLEPLAPGSPDVTVAVGAGDVAADLHVDAHGWQAYVGRAPSRLGGDGPRVAVGAVVAAARAGARIYDFILGDLLSGPRHRYEGYASALTYLTDNEPLRDPDVSPPSHLQSLLVGVGSVGGAAVYTLANQPGLSGDFIVVDPDVLAEHNPHRALLATADGASSKRPKVDVAEVALACHNDLRVEAHQCTVTEFDAARPAPGPLPLVMVATDTIESRRAVQDCLPLDVVNAACHPDEVVVSGHRTGDGPCVYCLYIDQVLDAHLTRNEMISTATGLTTDEVNRLRVGRAPLDAAVLHRIEGNRRVPTGTLARYVGQTIDFLWDAELLYADILVDVGNGTSVAVAAPFVTVLAGALLAGEAMKRCGGIEYAPYALGVRGPGIRYTENVYVGPQFAILDNPPRSAGSTCLCRSTRRARLLAQRYMSSP